MTNLVTDEMIAWFYAADESTQSFAAKMAPRERNGIESVSYPAVLEFLDHFTDQHIAVDVEAKRALVEETIRPYLGNGETTGRIAERALRIMLWGYRDRPGYRQEWKP